jgi:hypothetical protein
VIGNAALPPEAAGVQVLSPDGAQVTLQTGRRLTFGRGNKADLFVPSGRDLSRRAGEIVALSAGGWVGNLSHTHALYVAGEDYHARLPPSGEHGPPGGWLVSRGTAVVGSMAMIRKGLALRVTVAGDPGGGLAGSLTCNRGCDGSEESTLRPLLLRPDTKLYLVALMLCRPWLLDPSHTASLPTAPQIARAALEFTSASHQLERLDYDLAFRSNLVAQVNDHLKYLRERVRAGGLAPGETRLTPTVIAQVLLANDVITCADLATIEKPEWRSQQEDLWWRTGS